MSIKGGLSRLNQSLASEGVKPGFMFFFPCTSGQLTGASRLQSLSHTTKGEESYETVKETIWQRDCSGINRRIDQHLPILR